LQPSSASAILQADPIPEKKAYYGSLVHDFKPEFERQAYSESSFSPAPPGNEALARLFLEDEHGALELYYIAVVELFYPLVRPNCDEFTSNPDTCLCTVRHAFVNLAILPDFFLNNEVVRSVLDLCP
jgi:hypothetical protein